MTEQAPNSAHRATPPLDRVLGADAMCQVARAAHECDVALAGSALYNYVRVSKLVRSAVMSDDALREAVIEVARRHDALHRELSVREAAEQERANAALVAGRSVEEAARAHQRQIAAERAAAAAKVATAARVAATTRADAAERAAGRVAAGQATATGRAAASEREAVRGMTMHQQWAAAEREKATKAKAAAERAAAERAVAEAAAADEMAAAERAWREVAHAAAERVAAEQAVAAERAAAETVRRAAARAANEHGTAVELVGSGSAACSEGHAARPCPVSPRANTPQVTYARGPSEGALHATVEASGRLAPPAIGMTYAASTSSPSAPVHGGALVLMRQPAPAIGADGNGGGSEVECESPSMPRLSAVSKRRRGSSTPMTMAPTAISPATSRSGRTIRQPLDVGDAWGQLRAAKLA